MQAGAAFEKLLERRLTAAQLPFQSEDHLRAQKFAKTPDARLVRTLTLAAADIVQDRTDRTERLGLSACGAPAGKAAAGETAWCRRALRRIVNINYQRGDCA